MSPVTVRLISNPTGSLSSGPRKLLATAAAVFACICLLPALPRGASSPACVDKSAPASLSGAHRTALLIPLASLVSDYRDNTKAQPEVQFSDSFLLAAVNTFVRFEVARRLTVRPPPDTETMAALPRASRYPVAGELEDSARAVAARLAESADAQLVVTVLSCTLGYRVNQPEGWRNNSGPGYERAVEATGFARVRLQIRDRDGEVVYECSGKNAVSRPLLYGMFNGRRMRAKREQMLQEDVVQAAQKRYAPPVVRAIARAVARAMPLR